MWAVRVARDFPLEGSHSRMVSSSLAVTRVRPSGLNASRQAGAVWPVRVRTRATLTGHTGAALDMVASQVSDPTRGPGMERCL